MEKELIKISQLLQNKIPDGYETLVHEFVARKLFTAIVLSVILISIITILVKKPKWLMNNEFFSDFGELIQFASLVIGIALIMVIATQICDALSPNYAFLQQLIGGK